MFAAVSFAAAEETATLERLKQQWMRVSATKAGLKQAMHDAKRMQNFIVLDRTLLFGTKLYCSSTAEQTGRDGLTYSVRYLLEPDELAGLQAAGLVPRDACEVVGMQAVADGVVAMLERDAVPMGEIAFQ